MIDPESLEWQSESRPSLAPDLVKKAQKGPPDPEKSRQGRKNRRNGADAERQAMRLWEAAGAIVTSQGGPGRRDFLAEFRGHVYSVEAKRTKPERATDGFKTKAYEQAVRQAKPGTIPVAMVAEVRHGVKTVWQLVTGDGPLAWAAWLAGDGLLPLGEQE